MRLLSKIGRGGFGRVDKVELEHGVIAACKVLDPDPELLLHCDLLKLRQRFRREVEIQQSLDPRYVLPIYDADLECDDPWFIMPLAEKDFGSEVAHSRSGSAAPVDELEQILEALGFVHDRGVVHRDLKPGNILFHDGRWKLSDFGLAMPPRTEQPMITSERSQWRTEDYCSPEQDEDFRNCTAQTDIYAFGCILHDLFGNGTRRRYQRQTATGPIGFVIEKCTEPDLHRRFKSAASVRNALLRVFRPVQVPDSDEQNDKWVSKLPQVGEWSPQESAEFLQHLHSLESAEHLESVFDSMDDITLHSIFQRDPGLWTEVAITYCRWCHGSFAFDHCDVLGARLDLIYSLGDLVIKTEAFFAALRLACNHNRYSVMHRVVRMGETSIEEPVAHRLAIEIEARQEHRSVLSCAEATGRDVNDFHSIIAACLKQAPPPRARVEVSY